MLIIYGRAKMNGWNARHFSLD